jgi:hypothetical protein
VIDLEDGGVDFPSADISHRTKTTGEFAERQEVNGVLDLILRCAQRKPRDVAGAVG